MFKIMHNKFRYLSPYLHKEYVLDFSEKHADYVKNSAKW